MLAETICGLVCISGQINIYKRGTVEIFKKIWNDNDNSLLNIGGLCSLRLLEFETVTIIISKD